MKNLRTASIAVLMIVSAGVAFAQAGGGKGPGGGPVASGSGMGMGMGMGPGNGHGAMRWGSDVTPGWALMTPQERNEHRDRMQAMKTYEECKTYQDQHHEQMAARAKERGGQALAQPRRDACSGLKR